VSDERVSWEEDGWCRGGARKKKQVP